ERPKVYRKSEKQRIRELMQQYLSYTAVTSVICFVISTIFLVDFLWPQHVTQESIVSVATRRTYSRNSTTTWWVVNTSTGHAIDIPFQFSDYYPKGESIRIHSSYFLQIPRKAEVRQHAQRIGNTIYGNFIFAPAALLMISGLGVALRKNVDYGFNLGVTSFVILVFLIFIVLII
ncbi:MAG TPA: hypothetical protein VK666_15985, partial [Chryseolinea sp.]|nr:hypothetical protein [Chryseolinea sp.]